MPIALFLPSPSRGVWHLGPFPIRAYAICIICGVIAAVWFGNRRWIARGGKAGEVADVALVAVPVGLVGARLYHVITDHDLYFGPGKHAIGALEVWNGGLGIWGGIAGGVLGGLFVARHKGIRVRTMMDAMGPALLLAQAIGRWGNYFNQELFGRPTTLPWGLEISPDRWPPPYSAANPPSTAYPKGPGPYEYATFHPTFLYECIWNLGAMGVVLYLDRRLKLGFGRCFALYVMCYTAGRAWIEDLRIDVAADGDHFLGLRFNVWTAIVMFVLATGYFVIAGRKYRGRQDAPYLEPQPEPEPASS